MFFVENTRQNSTDRRADQDQVPTARDCRGRAIKAAMQSRD
jgi:hypothetical protein